LSFDQNKLENQKKYPGTFITLEGPDGAGKTTQLRILSQELTNIGFDHIITRDPGGTASGKQIRRILLNTANPLSTMAELLLYQADRAQNVSEIIIPALEKGLLVFCDRYIDSTTAYQGYGRGLCLQTINQLNEISTDGLKPELTLLFDLESQAGLSRLHPGNYDRLESEALSFHKKVREGYLTLAKEEPDRFCLIDAGAPLTSVQGALRKIINERLRLNLNISVY
jgi:dTMP kinase